jgi:hypothetical protein
LRRIKKQTPVEQAGLVKNKMQLALVEHYSPLAARSALKITQYLDFQERKEEAKQKLSRMGAHVYIPE